MEEPSEIERMQRLTTVLSVIYLLYYEGYSATAGNEWMRPALCEETLRLGGSWRR
jgi:predicted RNA polymerase sigma factor